MDLERDVPEGKRNVDSYVDRKRWTKDDLLYRDMNARSNDYYVKSGITQEIFYRRLQDNAEDLEAIFNYYRNKPGSQIQDIETFKSAFFDETPEPTKLETKLDRETMLRNAIRTNWSPELEKSLTEMQLELERTNKSLTAQQQVAQAPVPGEDYTRWMKRKAEADNLVPALEAKKRELEKVVGQYAETKKDLDYFSIYESTPVEEGETSFDRYIKAENKINPDEARYKKEKRNKLEYELEQAKVKLQSFGNPKTITAGGVTTEVWDRDKTKVERNILQYERTLAAMDANAIQWEAKMKQMSIEKLKTPNYEKDLNPLIDADYKVKQTASYLSSIEDEMKKLKAKDLDGTLSEQEIGGFNKLVEQYNQKVPEYKLQYQLYEQLYNSPANKNFREIYTKLEDLQKFQEEKFDELKVKYPKANAFDIMTEKIQLKADEDWEKGKWHTNQFTTAVTNVYKTFAKTPNELLTAGRTLGMLTPGYSIFDWYADMADQNMKMTELTTLVKPSRYTQSVFATQADVTFNDVDYLLDYDNEDQIVNVRKSNGNVLYDQELKGRIINHYNAMPADLRPKPEGKVKKDLLVAGVAEQLAIMAKFVGAGSMTSGMKILGKNSYLLGAGGFSYSVEYNQIYNDVYEQTGDSRLANNIAAGSSAIMAGLEALEPNRMLWDTNGIFRKQFVKNLIGAGTRAQTIKQASSQGLKEIIGENIQELLQNSSPDAVSFLADRMFGVEGLKYDFTDRDEIASTIILTTLTTGLANTLASAKTIAKSPTNSLQAMALNDYLNNEIRNPEEIIEKQFKANKITMAERDNALAMIQYADKFVAENFKPTERPEDGRVLKESEQMKKSDLVTPMMLALKAKTFELLASKASPADMLQYKKTAMSYKMASNVALAKLKMEKQNPNNVPMYRIMGNVFTDKALFLEEFNKFIKQSTKLDYDIANDEATVTEAAAIKEKIVAENAEKRANEKEVTDNEELHPNEILAKEQDEIDRRINQRRKFVKHADNKDRGSLIYASRKTGKSTWVKGDKKVDVGRHGDFVDVDDLIKEVLSESDVDYTEDNYAQVFDDQKEIDRIDDTMKAYQMIDSLYEKIEEKLADGKDVIGGQRFLLNDEFRSVDYMYVSNVERQQVMNQDLSIEEQVALTEAENNAIEKIGKRKVVVLNNGEFISKHLQARQDRFEAKEKARIEKQKLQKTAKLTSKNRGLKYVKDAIAEILKGSKRNEIRSLAEMMLKNKLVERLTFLEQEIIVADGTIVTGITHTIDPNKGEDNIVRTPYTGIRIDRSKIESDEELYETILHEEIHRYVDYILRSYDQNSNYKIELNKDEQEFAQEIFKLFREYKRNGGVYDIYEFVTEGLTREEEIQFNKKIRVNGKSIWSTLYDLILKLIGVDPKNSIYSRMYSAFENYYEKVSQNVDSIAYNDAWQVDARQSRNAEFLARYGLYAANSKDALTNEKNEAANPDVIASNAAKVEAKGPALQAKVSDETIEIMKQNGDITYTNDENKICGKEGMVMTFTAGSAWELVEDLKGFPSHADGGVDLQFTENGVQFVDDNGIVVKAEDGLVVKGKEELKVENDLSEDSVFDNNTLDGLIEKVEIDE